jgi:hypothetical protein
MLKAAMPFSCHLYETLVCSIRRSSTNKRRLWNSSNVITYNTPAAAMQGLCNKLKHHWTNIAHHLYLKADAPVPLPTVGPLAELLNVSNCPPVQLRSPLHADLCLLIIQLARHVCTYINCLM